MCGLKCGKYNFFKYTKSKKKFNSIKVLNLIL